MAPYCGLIFILFSPVVREWPEAVQIFCILCLHLETVSDFFPALSVLTLVSITLVSVVRACSTQQLYPK